MARELVVNRALSGSELKTLLRADFDKLLDNMGELSDYIAYGRVGYDMRLRLHIDNPMHPESEVSFVSKPIAKNLVSENEKLSSVESAPLIGVSPDESVAANELHRDIISPNEERIRAGIPVPAIVSQMDGTKTTEYIKYPPDATLGDGDVTMEDKTRETRSEWNLPNPVVPLPATESVPGNLTGVGKCGHPITNRALSGMCTQCPAGTEWVDQSVPDKVAEDWAVKPT